MRRYGIYPYEYLGSSSRLEETSLPPREAFYCYLSEWECSHNTTSRLRGQASAMYKALESHGSGSDIAQAMLICIVIDKCD